MNPFVSKINHNAWIVPVTAMSLVLGFMVTAAWVTEQTRSSRARSLGPSQASRVLSGSLDLQEEYTKLQAQVAKLGKEKEELEYALSTQTEGTKVLNKNLQEAKLLAGLTEVTGPGVIVTLRDSKKTFQMTDQIIHDTDVLRVVNELWASGAEAISVNKLRVAGTTSFRCVGTTILVDNVRIASPVIIRAIGDPDTLMGAINLPGGILDEIRGIDPAMVKVETSQEMTLPAFTGSTERKYARAAKAS